METLAATPVGAMDAGWRARVASLDASARSALLAEADRLYGGGRDDRRRALHLWLALRDLLDPADPADAPRAHAILVGAPPGLEDIEPLARRALAEGGPEVRVAAGVALGRVEADRGEVDAAEGRFRAALAATRGTGGRLEFLAASSLADLSSRLGREYEALVLARRLLVLARAEPEETRLRYALLSLAKALARLEEWALVAAPLAEIDRSLEGRPEPYERTLRIFARGVEARRALAAGDPDAAARALDDAEARERAGASVAGEKRLLRLLRARVAEARGDHGEAERLLRAARDAPAPRNAGALEVLAGLVRCALSLRGPAGALEAARPLLAALESEGVPVHGTGRVLAEAAALAHLLRERCADPPEARRAEDLAAAAAIRRILEIDRCVRELPELAAPDPEDGPLLRRQRDRFVREHAALAARVRRRLLEVARDGGSPLAALRGDAGMLRACAWCARVLGAGGAWLPVGHLLPHLADLPVTHGICPDCVRSLRTEARA